MMIYILDNFQVFSGLSIKEECEKVSKLSRSESSSSSSKCVLSNPVRLRANKLAQKSKKRIRLTKSKEFFLSENKYHPLDPLQDFDLLIWWSFWFVIRSRVLVAEAAALVISFSSQVAFWFFKVVLLFVIWLSTCFGFKLSLFSRCSLLTRL